MKKTIIILLSTVLIAIFATPLIANFMVNTPNPFGWGFVTDSNKDTWINFFGGVLGSVIGLGGVVWTIAVQEQQRREDLAIQYKPVIDISTIDVETVLKNEDLLQKTLEEIENLFESISNKKRDDSDGLIELISKDNKVNTYLLSDIKLKNLGDGEGKIIFSNIELESDYFNLANSKTTDDSGSSIYIKKDFNFIIPRHTEKVLSLFIQANSNYPSKQNINIKIPIRIEDMFKEKNYFYIMDLKYYVEKGRLAYTSYELKEFDEKTRKDD